MLDHAFETRESKVFLIVSDSIEEYEREYQKRNKDHCLSLEQMGVSDIRVNSHCIACLSRTSILKSNREHQQLINCKTIDIRFDKSIISTDKIDAKLET